MTETNEIKDPNPNPYEDEYFVPPAIFQYGYSFNKLPEIPLKKPYYHF